LLFSRETDVHPPAEKRRSEQKASATKAEKNFASALREKNSIGKAFMRFLFLD
jgi:hypothetical protein